jgi:hypothetical protein
MFDLPIGTGFYQSEILPLAAQTCTNWIPIKPTSGALSTQALLDRKGLTSFATLSGEFRGDCIFRSVYYTVNGTTLSSITSAGAVTTIGTIDGSNRVSIAVNDDYIVIVNSAGDGWYYNGTTLSSIVDAQFLPAKIVVFVDGYFIFTTLDGTQFFLSGINDPSAYSALDRSSAEARPDLIVGAFVYGGILHILGAETIERYNNIGGVNFPFQRISQATIPVGCYAAFSTVDVEDSFCFIGGSKNEGAQIYIMGGSAQSFSSPAIDNAIQEFTDAEIAEAFAFSYQQNGQHIAGFTIKSDRITGRTFCYNFSSQEWWESKSLFAEFRGKSVTKIYNKYLVGDDDNKVGYFDDVHTDYGDAIYREKATQPFLSEDGEEYRIGLLEAWFQAGTGSGTVNPQVMMDYSDDLGFTWSTPQWRGIGLVGEYGIRAQWRKQGLVGRDRVYRFKCSDPYTFNFMKLTAR